MGEIKSTLELAMERTRNLVPSREEREEMARREDETQVLAAVRRFLIAESSSPLLTDLVSKQEADRPDFPWRDAVCRELARALVPGRNDVVVLDALRDLRFARVSVLEVRVREVLARSAELDREAEERVRETLSAEGIRGSAVRPYPNADPSWQLEQGRLRDEFAAQLARLLE